MSYPHVMTDTSVTINIKGKVFTFTDAHPNWNSIRSAIRNRKWQRVEKLVDIVRSIRKFSHGRVDVKNGQVFFKGKPLHNVITARIIKLQHEGAPFRPLVRFLDNLMKNPLQSAIDELYLFLEHGDLPLTPDGHFLAFKKVRDDYKDVHSGTYNNSVGKTVRMKREECDTDRNNTCSYGLHFCSESYLSQFGGARTVIVKINPKDVVAIPSDYNNAKGRTCAYKVVGELGVSFSEADMKLALKKAA